MPEEVKEEVKRGGTEAIEDIGQKITIHAIPTNQPLRPETTSLA